MAQLLSVNHGSTGAARRNPQECVCSAPQQRPARGEASITIPVIGVTATFSPKGLQAVAGMAVDAVDSVRDAVVDIGQASAGAIKGAAHAVEAVGSQATNLIRTASSHVTAGADAIADGVSATTDRVLDVAETVAGYGALAALGGAAVLRELA